MQFKIEDRVQVIDPGKHYLSGNDDTHKVGVVNYKRPGDSTKIHTVKNINKGNSLFENIYRILDDEGYDCAIGGDGLELASKSKNQLNGVPKEIIEKMLEYQVEQGNARDVSIFEKEIDALDKEGGFDWDRTKEGFDFWSTVLNDTDYDLFFNTYPKKKILPSDLKHGMKISCIINSKIIYEGKVFLKNEKIQLLQNKIDGNNDVKSDKYRFSYCIAYTSDEYFGSTVTDVKILEQPKETITIRSINTIEEFAELSNSGKLQIDDEVLHDGDIVKIINSKVCDDCIFYDYCHDGRKEVTFGCSDRNIAFVKVNDSILPQQHTSSKTDIPIIEVYELMEQAVAKGTANHAKFEKELTKTKTPNFINLILPKKQKVVKSNKIIKLVVHQINKPLKIKL